MAAVTNHGRGKPCTVPTVFLIDVLDNLFPALVFEVDVDIRRFGSLLGNESLEQNLLARRISRSDAQCEANRGIGRASAVLRNNSIWPWEWPASVTMA